MGYYATLVPTTALAKDAGGLHFGQGWAYAKNFIGPYRLWLTAILIAATIVVPLARRDRDRRLAIATAAMLGGRPRPRALHHRDRRRLHARPAAAAGVLRARAARVDRGPDDRASPGARWSSSASRVARGRVGDLSASSRSGRRRTRQSYLLSPISDFRAASGAKLAPDRHAVRPQRQRGRRRVRPRRARLLQAHRQGTAPGRSTRTRSC